MYTVKFNYVYCLKVYCVYGKLSLTDRHKEKHRERQRETQIDRERDRESQRETKRDTQRERIWI